MEYSLVFHDTVPISREDILESRKGQYGTLNRTWKYNQDYTAPLNPKK